MKVFNRPIGLYGEPALVGASKTAITALEYDIENNISRAKGATVPTDGDAGYAVGSIFVKTNGGAGTTFYVNEGSVTSADFNVSAGSTGDITEVVAGAGLTGGGASGSVTLTVVNTDGKITVGANSIDITAGSLVNADISASAVIAYSKLAALTSAHILVGSAGNVATDVAVTGDISITNAGLTAIVAGVIVNADVNASAAIAESKIAFDNSAGHSHNGVDSKLVSVGTATSIAQAATIEAGANDVNLSTTTQTVGATTLTIPDFASVADTFVFATLAQTLANKSLTDSTTYFKDNADATKVMQFQCSEITAGQTRTLTVPDFSGTIATLAGTETLSGKTLTAPKILTTDFIADGGGDELLVFVESATPVNYVQIQNADTLTAAVVRGNGSDAAVDLKLYGKGTGRAYICDSADPTIKVGFDIDAATTGKTMLLLSTHTDDRTLTLPNATDTLVGKATGDVFTNKTIDADGTGNVITNINADELDPVGDAAYGIPFVISKTVANLAAAGTNIITTHPKMRILDVWFVATSADTGTLSVNLGQVGSVGAAITDTFSIPADDMQVTRCGEIDDLYHSVAINGGLVAVGDGGASIDGIVYVMAMRID